MEYSNAKYQPVYIVYVCNNFITMYKELQFKMLLLQC